MNARDFKNKKLKGVFEMSDYIAVPKEKFLRLTKDLLDKTIVDSKGARVGKIEDVVISDLNDCPVVDGIITNKQFILWKDIAGLSEYAILNKRFFSIAYQNLDASKILLSKQLLDEQLINEKGSNIGRIDDLALMYSNIEKKLNVLGICTGVQLRVGIQKYYDILPWQCVKGFREKPSAVIVNAKGKQSVSYTNKISVMRTYN